MPKKYADRMSVGFLGHPKTVILFFAFFFHVSKGFPEYFSVPFGVYHEQKRNFMGLWWDIGVEINVGIIWETVQGLFSKAVELFSTWHKDTMDGCEMRHQLIGAGLPIIVSGFQASKVVQDFFQRYCNCLLPPLGSSPGMLQDISDISETKIGYIPIEIMVGCL